MIVIQSVVCVTTPSLLSVEKSRFLGEHLSFELHHRAVGPVVIDEQLNLGCKNPLRATFIEIPVAFEISEIFAFIRSSFIVKFIASEGNS